MVYIAADLHASQQKWTEQIHPVLKSGDIIIVAGDFGVGFWGNANRTEEQFYDWLSLQPYTVLFLDGNHENFDHLAAYPTVRWNGGTVHEIRKNVLHLMRGEIYTIEGKRVFTFGGGYSFDRHRRAEGVSWWPQELPCDAEYHNASANLERHGHQVDYIITHTAPGETVRYLSTFGSYGIAGAFEEQPLNSFLDYIQSSTEHQRYYFGHFHIDAELWRNQTVVYNYVRELETGEIVRQWDTRRWE